MKTLNVKYTNKDELQSFVTLNQIENSSKTLLQVFSGITEISSIENFLSEVLDILPNIQIIGATTSGEILEYDTLESSMVLSFSTFEKTEIQVFDTDFYKSSGNTAEKLISLFPQDKTPQVAISFVDGLTINGEEYINSFHSYNPNVIISGGLAGDNALFVQTIVFTHNRIVENGAVVALLFNPQLQVSTTASFGWEDIGKTMTITKSDKNIVYEIDNIPVVDIYAKYLGANIAKDLPKVGIEFPLIIHKENISIPRAVLGVHNKTALVFAGNLHIGDKVTFGYGNIDSILEYSKNIGIKNSESIFIYSCMARKYLLKDSIKLELKPLSQIANLSGFFTYGEFYSNTTTNECNLLNETMTILSLSENANQITPLENASEININSEESDRNLTLKAFSHLISQTTLEFEELNQSLEKKIKDEVAKNVKKEEILQKQSRLAQMGEMISMIAHQWRQPLGAINSSVIGIESKISIGKFDFTIENDRTKFFKFLNRKLTNITEYVGTLSETIDDFRNFFKPDKQKELVNLTEPITRALKIVENAMSNKGIEISTKFDSEIDIYMYQNELMQVILNILKNSEDNFVEQKIKNPKINIETYFQDSNYFIAIQDNGGGIPKSIRCKIFDPYFSTKNEKNGTGLGLYMSKIMIEEHHNGFLSVENQNGGAYFLIQIQA